MQGNTNVFSAYKNSNANPSFQYDLVNNNFGPYIGLVNNIVTTNNQQINAIFQSFNVTRHYNGNFINYSGDSSQLYNALQSLSSIISDVDICNVVFLNTKEETKIVSSTISPNPFSKIFEISSKVIITNYKLFDVFGKLILNTNSKINLNSNSELLKAGMYILELTFETGKKDSVKLIKN